MYGILGLLFARAMNHPPKTTIFRVVTAAFLLVAAVGALDEWHQKYMAGRSTEFADWMADSSGGLLGALAWSLRLRLHDSRTT
jgi:VanZ family protein